MPQNSIVIRRAMPGDEGILASLAEEAHELHHQARPDLFASFKPAAFHKWFGELLEQNKFKFWIAEVDGEPAGYVSAARKMREANPFCHAREWCEIDNLAVNRSFQGRGIGRKLMETAMADSRAMGVTEFELTTWWFNEHARAVFQSLGFRPRTIRFEQGG